MINSKRDEWKMVAIIVVFWSIAFLFFNAVAATGDSEQLSPGEEETPFPFIVEVIPERTPGQKAWCGSDADPECIFDKLDSWWSV